MLFYYSETIGVVDDAECHWDWDWIWIWIWLRGQDVRDTGG